MLVIVALMNLIHFLDFYTEMLPMIFFSLTLCVKNIYTCVSSVDARTKGPAGRNLIKKGTLASYSKNICLECLFISRISWRFPKRPANFATYSLNQLTNFTIFSWNQLTNFVIIFFFFTHLGVCQVSGFVLATDWQISWFFSMTDRSIWMFLWQSISEFRIFFSCSWSTNFCIISL